MVLARAEGRDFHLPGGDGTIVAIAGGWAGLLIFYRVFDRPAGDGYPVGIEWGFFLAFVASGSLAYAGLRMRAAEAPAAPLVAGPGARRSERPRRPPANAGPPPDLGPAGARSPQAQDEVTVIAPAHVRPARSAPVPARGRPRYPPAPPEQLSIEDTEPEDPLISD
jgi:hypothetical protein